MAEDKYHHGNLREALISSAEQLIRAQGTAAVTLRSVARNAGVSSAAPYHHFADWDAVLAEIAARGFRRLEAQMLERAEGLENAAPLSKLRSVGAAYVQFAVSDPEIFRLMFGGRIEKREQYEGLAAASDRALKVPVRLLAQTNDQGALAKSSLDGLALTLWALVHGLAMLILDGRLEQDPEIPLSVQAEKWVEQVTTVLGTGLRHYVTAGRAR